MGAVFSGKVELREAFAVRSKSLRATHRQSRPGRLLGMPERFVTLLRSDT